MKKIYQITNIFILFFLITGIAFANNNYKQLSDEKYQSIEENLLIGLSSDNFGLKSSAIYYLGEFQSEKAVIPLMRILSNEEADIRERIIAALSLYKIGNERGIYRIKMLSQNSENVRLRKLAEKFYISHILKEDGNMPERGELKKDRVNTYNDILSFGSN